MALKLKINDDLKDAMRNKEELKLSVLRMLTSAIRNKEIEKRTKLSKGGSDTGDALEKASELTDDEVMDVLRSETKKRKDAIEGFEKAARVEMAEKERHELAILQTYLPQELNDEELQILVREAIGSTGASTMKDFGKVMSAVMARAKNQVSGDRVSAAVKELLGK